MLKRLCIVLGMTLAASGAARADDGCGTGMSAPPKTQEYQRLLDCARQRVAEAEELLGGLSDLKIDEYANGIANERDGIEAVLTARTAAWNQAKADLVILRNENDGLKGYVADLNKTLAAARARDQEARGTIRTLLSQIGQLGSERDQLNARVAELTSALEVAFGKLQPRRRNAIGWSSSSATRTGSSATRTARWPPSRRASPPSRNRSRT